MNTHRKHLTSRAHTARCFRPPVAYVVMVLMLLAGGCYESSVPLAPREDAAIDSSLFGTWLLIDEEEAQTLTRMRVEPYDAHSYYVEFCCSDVLYDRVEADRLRAHLVPVDSVTFANAQSLTEVEAPYVFFRYDLSDAGILTLRPVAECLFAQTNLPTSEAFYSFLQAHLGHERLYFDETLRFRKVAD